MFTSGLQDSFQSYSSCASLGLTLLLCNRYYSPQVSIYIRIQSSVASRSFIITLRLAFKIVPIWSFELLRIDGYIHQASKTSDAIVTTRSVTWVDYRNFLQLMQYAFLQHMLPTVILFFLITSLAPVYRRLAINYCKTDG